MTDDELHRWLLLLTPRQLEATALHLYTLSAAQSAAPDRQYDEAEAEAIA